MQYDIRVTLLDYCVCYKQSYGSVTVLWRGFCEDLHGWCLASGIAGVTTPTTSDSHGYQSLTTVFDLCSRPRNLTTRRLLIMDRHSSYITANVISYCTENSIGLLILPPHTSQITQPLDGGVFGPLQISQIRR